MEKRIEVYARYLEKNGSKFTVYDTKKKDGGTCNCKFTENCKDDATDNGIIIPEGKEFDKKKFIVMFDSENANYSESGRYPTLWINKVNAIEEYKYKDTVADNF